jgi:hypothetical protein
LYLNYLDTDKRVVKECPYGPVLGIKLTRPITSRLASYLANSVDTDEGILELGRDRYVRVNLALVIQKVIGLMNEGEIILIGNLVDGRHNGKPNRTPGHRS